ncbi:hypothetical protein D3C83_300060 [compost metagenome]
MFRRVFGGRFMVFRLCFRRCRLLRHGGRVLGLGRQFMLVEAEAEGTPLALLTLEEQ